MRAYLPGAVVGLVIALVGIAMGNLPVVLLGIVVAIAIIALVSMRQSQPQTAVERVDDLSPDSRILIRPLKKIYQEMEQAAAGKSESISPYIAGEALAESRRLLEQSVAALVLRDRLVKQVRGRYEAEKSLNDLSSRATTATSDDEKHSLDSAIAARSQEISHYDSLKDGITKIESSVRQAEATLAEMRARLMSSSSSGLAEQGSDPLRDTVGRMQALSSSLSEAQQMLEGKG